jgi:hypothetical protein
MKRYLIFIVPLWVDFVTDDCRRESNRRQDGEMNEQIME